MIIQKQVSLASYTSWSVGGPAEYFCLPQNIEEIKEALSFAHQRNLTVTILGGGTNVLVSDSGVLGLTICLQKFVGMDIKQTENRLIIQVLSGTSKTELLRIFLKFNLAPALFLAGLPGDVGGGVVMNAGVAEIIKPREFFEIVDWIEVLRFSEAPKKDRQIDIQKIEGKDLDWQYRHCKGWQPGIITCVQMSWPMEPDSTILEKVKKANQVRLMKQPLDQPSCGSVFVNPDGYKAAQLIDSCGLKGFSIGGAEISTKHANFIVNKNQAKASDIWQIIQHIKKTVLNKTGVELKTEVVLLGMG